MEKVVGYTTDFSGRVNLSRQLTEAEAAELVKWSDTRHGGNLQPDPDVPGFWCQWVPTDDRMGIEWDGGEKFYEADEWMRYIINHFIAPWGISATGTIDASGEESGDIWRIVVNDNVVRRVNARVVFEETS